MTRDVHDERIRLRQTGDIDPLYAAAELYRDVAKQRLKARQKLAEAQIELATIECYEASSELCQLQETRRKMKVEGRPMVQIPAGRIL
jgi:hypothetical protein